MVNAVCLQWTFIIIGVWLVLGGTITGIVLSQVYNYKDHKNSGMWIVPYTAVGVGCLFTITGCCFVIGICMRKRVDETIEPDLVEVRRRHLSTDNEEEEDKPVFLVIEDTTLDSYLIKQQHEHHEQEQDITTDSMVGYKRADAYHMHLLWRGLHVPELETTV